MNIPELVTQTVNILTPALPIIATIMAGAEKKVGEKLADASIHQAKLIWDWILPKAAVVPALKEAVTDLEQQPDDPDSQATVRVQLRKLLEKEPGLFTELQKIIESVPAQANHVAASGKGSVAIGGNVSGSSITTNITR